MQVVCDSLVYTDLDSLVRLYRSPMVWNEIRRQYSADSITVVLKNQALDKASLMSNAFIVIQEDTLCYDQIKGTEMMAYFDSTGVLKRFDSMGGASGLFFVEEKGAFATVNKFESKMLTATFTNGNINDLNYFEEVKSDAYPAVQLRGDERVLKGFEWKPERRPKGPADVVAFTPRKSERTRFENVPRAKFVQTEIYFPGHIAHINKMLASADSLKQVRRAEQEMAERMRKAKADSLAAAAQAALPDSLAAQAPSAMPDSLGVPDTPAMPDSLGMPDPTAMPDSLAAPDSLAMPDSLAVPDSLAAAKALADSIKTARMDSLRKALAFDPEEAEKALKKAERDARAAQRDTLRAARAAKKEAKWAALDAKDAEKAERKAQKAAVRREKELKKMLKAKEKRDAREQRLLERYKKRYEKKKARQDATALKKSEAALKKKNESSKD